MKDWWSSWIYFLLLLLLLKYNILEVYSFRRLGRHKKDDHQRTSHSRPFDWARPNSHRRQCSNKSYSLFRLRADRVEWSDIWQVAFEKCPLNATTNRMQPSPSSPPPPTSTKHDTNRRTLAPATRIYTKCHIHPSIALVQLPHFTSIIHIWTFVRENQSILTMKSRQQDVVINVNKLYEHNNHGNQFEHQKNNKYLVIIGQRIWQFSPLAHVCI